MFCLVFETSPDLDLQSICLNLPRAEATTIPNFCLCVVFVCLFLKNTFIIIAIIKCTYSEVYLHYVVYITYYISVQPSPVSVSRTLHLIKLKI